MTSAHTMYAVFALTLSLLVIGASASYLTVEGPVSSVIYNNGTIALGDVGPGESFYVLASAATANASGAEINIGWDTLEAVKLPQGWASEASPAYENPMKLKVTVAPTATNDTYVLELRAVNIGNYSKLGNLTFNASVVVTPDVFVTNVTPIELATGVGQPANLHVVINNTGVSDDPFVLNAQGIPGWYQPVEVISDHNTSSTYLYPVLINEPGVYRFNFTISSSTSPLLQHTYKVTLVAESSLMNDYIATGQGVILSPVIYEPAYAVMLGLNYVYKLIFH